jgi:hypothetical protein
MKYLRLGFFISILAVMGIFAVIVIQFAIPRERKISLGPVDTYPPSNNPYVIELDPGTAYLYNDQGSIRIFYRRNPSPNGCLINWNEIENAYIDPCTGTKYRINGSYIDGPTQRDLKELKVEIVKGIVWVYPLTILE